MKPSVLIVDDDPGSRLALKVALESLRAELTFVESGEEARALLLDNEFSVVLLDVKLPGLDGWETARLIREANPQRRVSIVFLTGVRKAPDQILSGYEAGGVDYLLKPIDPDILRAKVSVFLELHSREQELEALVVRLEEQGQSLRESEERFQLAIDGAALGTWDWDVASGRIIFSERWAGMLGYAPGEVEPSVATREKLTHPDDWPDVRDALEAHLAGDTPYYEAEHRARHKSGHWVWVLDRGRVIARADDGKPLRACGTLLDITLRKQAEEQRHERKMIRAQKLESLGVLAGGIAHDFNNLLTVIMGNTELALHELPPSSPTRNSLHQIEKASQYAAKLAGQMLTYSGKGRFNLESIDARVLVKEIAQLLKVSISKSVVIEYRFSKDIPAFDGDVTQIRQVVMNLVTNASEAIGDEEGIITLSSGPVDCERAYLDGLNEFVRDRQEEPLAEGLYTCIEVTDTGCGMDAHALDRIFDPFFTTKFTGRGLGLSAVLGIVRGHKGAIDITSEVGEGTTFKILLPANGHISQGSEQRTTHRGIDEDWRGSGTILVADDEQGIRAVVKRMLEFLDFRVLAVPDGDEALRVYREHADEIVCVLLDLTMPRLGGEETFHQLKRLQPEVLVVLTTGYNESELTQRLWDDGLAGFIRKPFSLGVLREKLREILDD